MLMLIGEYEIEIKEMDNQESFNFAVASILNKQNLAVAGQLALPTDKVKINLQVMDAACSMFEANLAYANSFRVFVQSKLRALIGRKYRPLELKRMQRQIYRKHRHFLIGDGYVTRAGRQIQRPHRFH